MVGGGGGGEGAVFASVLAVMALVTKALVVAIFKFYVKVFM